MHIYIPSIDFKNTNRKSLFILTRPFYAENAWVNDALEKQRWGIDGSYEFTNQIAKATHYFIPNPINTYTASELSVINKHCATYHIKAYGYISGDFGTDYGCYPAIVFFRMGGFKSKLSKNNKGLPVSLSDHFERLYQQTEITPRKKQNLPLVGFCGHASLGFSKRIKEQLKFLRENGKRFLRNPMRTDYEPLFSSAYERAKLLLAFEASDAIKTNFIYRENYRGGAVTEPQRQQTTIEYYDNIKNSDYVVCVRGAGNFSVRLYETLMMGRIPIFVNTDCLLPFEDRINWKKHVVWVEWKDRKKIAQMVADFHTQVTPEEFVNLQMQNRKLWKETLSVKGMLEMISSSA